LTSSPQSRSTSRSPDLRNLRRRALIRLDALMRGRFRILLLMSFALSSSLCLAQAPPTPFPDALALPKGNGAWVIQVSRTGGFAGVFENVSISSDGASHCNGKARCPAGFVVYKYQPLVEAVFRLNQSAAVPNNTPPVKCSDCFTNGILIRYRDGMGIEHTYTASWPGIAENVPPEIIQIYEEVIALQK
jgi:hypothetical protein